MNSIDPNISLAATVDTVDNSPVATQAESPPAATASSAPTVADRLVAAQDTTNDLLVSAEDAPTIGRIVEVLTTFAKALIGALSSLLRGLTSQDTQQRQVLQATEASDVSGVDTEQSTSVSGGSVADASDSSTVAQSLEQGDLGSELISNVSSAKSKGTPSATRSLFDVTRNDLGQIAVRTLDGFLVRAEGRDEAWSITGPDGRTTRVWGDPHVVESDGKKWDFLNRSTFQFGSNKATVEVVPLKNGASVTSRITLYSGDERVTIDGIDKNRPLISAVSADGHEHDDGLADGVTYRRAVAARGESWRSNLTGKVM